MNAFKRTAFVRRRRRGFAIAMAIAMTAVAAAAMLSLSALLRFDAGRTRQAARDAQLRQLLKTGTDIAAARVHSATISATRPTVEMIRLPESLSSAKSAVRISIVSPAESPAAGTSIPVRVEAWFAGESAAQQLLFSRSEDHGWHLTQIVQENPPPREVPNVVRDNLQSPNAEQ